MILNFFLKKTRLIQEKGEKWFIQSMRLKFVFKIIQQMYLKYLIIILYMKIINAQ